MPVRLRLRRTGTRNKACFRIVAADSRSPRDGRFIERLGYYNPRGQDEKIDLERAEYWINNGAQPSGTVAAIIERAKNPKVESESKPEPGKKVEDPVIDSQAEDISTEAPGKDLESEKNSEKIAKSDPPPADDAPKEEKKTGEVSSENVKEKVEVSENSKKVSKNEEKPKKVEKKSEGKKGLSKDLIKNESEKSVSEEILEKDSSDGALSKDAENTDDAEAPLNKTTN